MPEHEHGRHFAHAMIMRIATAALFSRPGGRAFPGTRPVSLAVVIFAGAFAFAGFPSALPSPAAHGFGGHPSVSRSSLCAGRSPFPANADSWMFLGFALLMMSPLQLSTWRMRNMASGGRASL